MRRTLLILVIAGLPGASPAAIGQETSSKILGPYVQNVTYRSAVICWATPAGKSSVTFPDGKILQINNYQHHEILLDGLKPNITYPFDVLQDGSDAGKGQVTTFPREITPFKFVVIGDTRSRHDVHQKNVNRAIAEKPLFVVNTGDLVANGRRMGDWEKFFQVNKALLRATPYYPVLGNHEKDSPHYFDFFDLPGNERYYAFSVGDAFFVFLDTEGAEYQTPRYLNSAASKEYFWANYNKRYFDAQKVWLEQQLQMNKDAGFIFVFFHQPVFSVKKSRVADAKAWQQYWGDIFERYGVQVVLNGHDHHYHRAFRGGTHYITSGGGGAGLYEPDAPQPETQKIAKIEHIIRVDVGLQKAVLTAIDINGDIIEKITVEKRK